MATIKVIAGDFLKGDSQYTWGNFSLRTKEHTIFGESISAKKVESITLASEESIKKLGGTVGWGAVGALALGPIGLLAGVLLGGKSKDITFIAVFKDGRKVMATTDVATYNKLLGATL